MSNQERIPQDRATDMDSGSQASDRSQIGSNGEQRRPPLLSQIGFNAASDAELPNDPATQAEETSCCLNTDTALPSDPPAAQETSLNAEGAGNSLASRSAHSAAEHKPTKPSLKKIPRRTWADVFSQLIWFAATVAIVVGFWKLGPKLVEEYHYSMRLGQARAEHQNAVLFLKDQPLTNMSNAYKLVAQKVRPSVVSIISKRAKERTRGQGSGVIISNEGYIITSAHVVENANQILVRLYNRYPHEAELIAKDTNSDLAILKINAPDLIAAEWGSSEALDVGSLVWAIGSPYGLDQTVTSGIVSGKHRVDQKSNYELLQTDAAVNPGNSGGPLVDAAGNVVGINTSIFGESFQGISFAVPSETARFVAEQLISNGKVRRGYLGIYPMPVINSIASQKSLQSLNGALVSNVDEDTPASRSGFLPEDVILEWDGKPVIVHTMLHRYIERTPPNSTVPVKIIRDGVELMLQATVGERSRFVPY